MDAEDRRRYFIVGSVILEIVQPLFRTRLENNYNGKGLVSFQAFLNTQPVIHILFHLRHRNAYCCQDKLNCQNNSKLPLIYCQWDLLYTENPGQPGHNCHCKFTANQVQLNDLDITLASLILLNCCNLLPTEKDTVRRLRRYKNDYLSHNTEGKISETEYKSLWTDLTNFVLQLDPTKKDDLIRIKKRPLDEALCTRYSANLLNIHKKLNEMDIHIQGIGSAVQELLSYHRNEAKCQNCKNKLIEEGMDERKLNPCRLGQDIFDIHNQIDLNTVINISMITDVVLMDNGCLVILVSDSYRCRMLICNTDGSDSKSMAVEGKPYYLTAVNNSTVAVISSNPSSNCSHIEMYDIVNKYILRYVTVRGMRGFCGISMINDNLVVCGINKLMIVDHQTGHVVKQKELPSHPCGIHASGERIFYREPLVGENNLNSYTFTDDKIQTLTLPSSPRSMTTLQDGSLYVHCKDGSIQHVSSDGKHFKSLTADQCQLFSDCHKIQYNSVYKTFVTLNFETANVKILHEK